MKENSVCKYKINIFLDGKKDVVLCNPKKGCLRDRVWNGGIKKEAARLLGLDDTDGIEAYVEGECDGQASSGPTSEVI